jgi:hypothetical protein
MTSKTGFPVLIPDPTDIEAMQEWLMDSDIDPIDFNMVDVSDVSLYHDVMLEIIFRTEEEMTLFKLTWMVG